MFMPLLMRPLRTGSDREPGPMVQTILVLWPGNFTAGILLKGRATGSCPRFGIDEKRERPEGNDGSSP